MPARRRTTSCCARSRRPARPSAAAGRRPGPAPALAARLEKRIPVAAGLGGGRPMPPRARRRARGVGRRARRRRPAGASPRSSARTCRSSSPAARRWSRAAASGWRRSAACAATPGVLLVTPRGGASPRRESSRPSTAPRPGDGSVRMSSVHLAEELRPGCARPTSLARAGVLASANDLLPAAAAVVPGARAVPAGADPAPRPPDRAVRLRPDPVGALSFAAEAERRGRRSGGASRADAPGARHAPVRRPPRPSSDRSHQRGGADRMTRQPISTTGAPAAVGPYSQAIAPAASSSARARSGSTRRPASSSRAASRPRPSGSCEPRARSSRRPASAGRDVVKTTIFLVDIGDFAAVNAIYARFMPIRRPPARRSPWPPCPKGARVEIEAIAAAADASSAGPRRLTPRTGRPYDAADPPMTYRPTRAGTRHGVGSDRPSPDPAPRGAAPP